MAIVWYILPVIITIGLVIWMILFFKPPSLKSFTCSTDKQCNHGKCQNNKCICDIDYTGIDCSILNKNINPESPSENCALHPRKCVSNEDCRSCGTNLLFECQELSESENPRTNMKGKFCLPSKPKIGCDSSTGGMWRWYGWKDVEAMAWQCDCLFPNYYTHDDSGNCTSKNPELCRFGEWTYPRDGSNPLLYGGCKCENVSCKTDDECIEGCDSKTKTCKDQKTGWNRIAGIPTCTRDPCQPHGKWKSVGKAPYTTGVCDCDTGYVYNGYSCVKDV